VMCRMVHVTKMTGSSSDDWFLLALWLQPLVITLTYSAIANPHTLQSTIACALGFSVSTSRLLATGLTTVTSTHCTNSPEDFICSHTINCAEQHYTALTHYSLHHESYPRFAAVHLLIWLHHTNLL
jgi:hypothetical protein